jgi:hypothetical protein
MKKRRKCNENEVSVGGINGGSKSDTICWECANATDQSKCCWVKDYTPVEGWDAVPRRIRYNGSIVDSYMVKACPNFKEG